MYNDKDWLGFICSILNRSTIVTWIYTLVSSFSYDFGLAGPLIFCPRFFQFFHFPDFSSPSRWSCLIDLPLNNNWNYNLRGCRRSDSASVSAVSATNSKSALKIALRSLIFTEKAPRDKRKSGIKNNNRQYSINSYPLKSDQKKSSSSKRIPRNSLLSISWCCG